MVNSGIVIRSVMPEISPTAEMVVGDWWSGWAWEGELVGWHFIWRGQGDTGAAYRFFPDINQLNQFCDGLEGETDEFVRN